MTVEINAYAQYNWIFSSCKIGILKILLTENPSYSLITNLYFTFVFSKGTSFIPHHVGKRNERKSEGVSEV